MEIVHYIKEELMKKGADDVVLEYVTSEGTQLKFVNNKIVKTGTEVLNNLAIFVVQKGKIISTSLKDLNKDSADKLITNIFKFLKNSEPSKDYRGIAKGPFKYKNIEGVYDKKVLDFDEVDLLNKGINAALENSKRVSGIFETSMTSDYLLTSNGAEVEEKSTNLYFSIRAFNKKEESGHMTACSRSLNDFTVEDAGRKAGEIAKLAKNPVSFKDGKYDVVFSYLPMASILEYIMDLASVFHVESGLSFFKDQVGKKLGNFDLIDDGTLAKGYNSTKFDCEGHPTQKNMIIDKGVFKTYLHNTSSASRYKVKNTANAGLLVPSAFNILFDSEKSNVLDQKKAIYITNIWYTRFQNYQTGDFSTIPRDGMFLIENGEIVKSLKNIRISDNMLNIMKNINSCGEEKKQIRSWEANTPVTTPEVLVKDVNVTKPHG
ncbi:MAG: TldD/PmbA family protein [Nanoarchaeota archaeon]|nr:TldD/PmbA family protein [Nanoarchaeota archaeon]